MLVIFSSFCRREWDPARCSLAKPWEEMLWPLRFMARSRELISVASTNKRAPDHEEILLDSYEASGGSDGHLVKAE